MPKRHETKTNSQQMGIAELISILPGLNYARDLIDRRIEELQGQLVGLLAPEQGRPRKNGLVVGTREEMAQRKGSGKGWPTDPEARSVEMMRRRQVAREKKLAGERHARYVAAGKARWAGRSKKEIAEHSRLMNEARQKKLRGSANPNHPGNPNHPDHAAFAERVAAAKQKKARQERAAA